MAWVAVDSINRELIFRNEPFRDIDTDYMVTYHGWFDGNMNSWGVELPKGTIKKLIGKDLTWNDNPVELKEELTMWIARDKDGLLHLHEKKPIKTIYGWYNPGWIATLPSYILPEVKWEDEEPRELVLKPINEEQL